MAAGFKICTMERCSSPDERAVADLHSNGHFAATLWLSTTGINEMPTRHSSCPGAARLLDRAFQGAIVVTRLTECGTWFLPRAGRVAPDAERVPAGIVARSIPSFWSVTSGQTGMRHNPNAQLVNNTLGAVYIRRTPRAFACTDNESARKLTSTLLVHSVQLSGRRTDEFQNRLCLLNLVCEALENANGGRRRNEESNSLAGEFEMMRNLLVTRGNPALQRASG